MGCPSRSLRPNHRTTPRCPTSHTASVNVRWHIHRQHAQPGRAPAGHRQFAHAFYKTAELPAELHLRLTGTGSSAPCHAHRPLPARRACGRCARQERAWSSNSAVRMSARIAGAPLPEAGRRARKNGEGPSMHEMEGPARSRSPDALAHAQRPCCSIRRRAGYPPGSQCPGSRAPGMLPDGARFRQ